MNVTKATDPAHPDRSPLSGNAFVQGGSQSLVTTPCCPERFRLGVEPSLAPTARVEDSRLGRFTEVAEQARLIDSVLGDYSYLMERSDVMSTTIGKFANIAAEVRLNPGNHPMDWVSQHHFLYRSSWYWPELEDRHDFFAWRRLQRVHIGHDTWIGHRAIVLAGCSVGNGAVVAAGAVVSRDVPPYSVVAGVPAKVVRSRFPESVWRLLDAIAWWDWDHETLQRRLKDFYDIRRFIDTYGPAAA